MTRQHSAVQSPDVLDVISHSVAQTDRIGQRIGAQLRSGDLLLLLGDIGSGKTHLVKGLARGLGSHDLVTSPTFVLVNEYRADAAHNSVTIYHADLYRIERPDELMGIGLEEAWNGEGICLIEWAERAAGWLPDDHLAIHFRHLSENKRILRFVPHGTRYRALVDQLKETAFA